MRAELVQHITELLAGLGRLQSRPMFGGPRFLAARLKPFIYNKRRSRNYYRAPPEALESPEEALSWAREALGAALRSKRRKKKR